MQIALLLATFFLLMKPLSYLDDCTQISDNENPYAVRETHFQHELRINKKLYITFPHRIIGRGSEFIWPAQNP